MPSRKHKKSRARAKGRTESRTEGGTESRAESGTKKAPAQKEVEPSRKRLSLQKRELLLKSSDFSIQLMISGLPEKRPRLFFRKFCLRFKNYDDFCP